MSSEATQYQGLILKGIGGFYYVKTADAVFECRAKGIFRKRGLTPLAGDRVVIEGGGADWVIAEIGDRANALLRPPVANVDRLVLVSSTTDPAPNLQVLDRLTAIAERERIPVLFAFTKSDLKPAAPWLEIYGNAGYPCFDTAADADASARLRAVCAQGLTVFAGNSGVGKSTLLNKLLPDLGLATAEISKKLGRGKHTTRAVELFAFERGYIADTPGFSAMDFAGNNPIPAEDLADCFVEFAPYRDGCYFTGCTHTVEKGCAVLGALKKAAIAPSRHESYAAMMKEAQAFKPWQAEKK